MTTRIDDAEDRIGTYFQQLAQHPLLTAEDERSLARQIEAAEVRTWEAVLARAEHARAVLDVALAELDQPAKFPKFLAAIAARLGRRCDDAGAQRAYATVAREAARRLRKLDLDLACIEAVMRELGAIAVRGSEPGTYMDAANAERREARRLRDEFVSRNLRLVITMARRYDHGIMPLADLIQEGNLGLMHAVSRFDYRRGLRFSTYACWWIRHAIGRALADKARGVRVPVHMLEAQQQVERARARLIAELGRAPTPQEISREAKVPVEKMELLEFCITGASVSLDHPVQVEGVDMDYPLVETFADPDTEDETAEDVVHDRAMLEAMRRMMGQLSKLEIEVLSERFGLDLGDGGEGRPLRAIGEQHDLSRERIRQIQNGALDKLRVMMERELGDDDDRAA